MHVPTITLDHFAPDSIWFTSLGAPTGVSIIINGQVEDDMTGEWYEAEGDWSGVPFEASKVSGTVSPDGKSWEWDGHGEPCDWNRNTIRTLSAYRSQES